jgi:hypothetical protein
LEARFDTALLNFVPIQVVPAGVQKFTIFTENNFIDTFNSEVKTLGYER